jgi:hypothetical protein
MHDAGSDMSGHTIRAEQVQVLERSIRRAGHEHFESGITVIIYAKTLCYRIFNSFDDLPDDKTILHIVERAFLCIFAFTTHLDWSISRHSSDSKSAWVALPDGFNNQSGICLGCFRIV